jgi:hypothetical protein
VDLLGREAPMIAEARFSWRSTQASAIVAMLSPAPLAIGTSF